ncbi:glycosyltransferase family 39 protein [Patescibacteria group bacterium]|nr:glycosyltransferase family 39 protein [Patescibacteria group bacterium]
MIKQIFKNRGYFWLVALLTLAGLGLRLLFSHFLGSYWFDELYAVNFTKFSFKGMLDLLIQDVNVPLYSIILWFWYKFFAETEFVTRLLSIIFAVGNIPLLYLIGKKLFNAKTALIAAIFYTLSTYQIFLTTEARPYSLLVFLSLLSTWFFWQLFNDNKTRLNWIGYILSSLLLAFTHLVGSFLILAQACFIIFNYIRRKKSIRAWLLSYSVIALPLLCYIIISFLVKKEAVFSTYLFYVPYDFHFFTEIFKYFFRLTNSAFYLELFYSLLPLFALASFLIVKRIKGDYDLGVKFKFSPPVVYSLALVLASLAGCFVAHWVTPRYLILASVFTYLLIGQGIVNWLNARKAMQASLMALIIFSLIVGYGSFFTERNYWTRVDECINQISSPDSKIIVHNFAFAMMLKRYYTGSLPVEGFYPINDSLSFAERVVQRGAGPVVTNDNVEKMAGAVEDYDNILLVEAIYVPILDPDNKVFKWFLNNGWQLQDNFCQIERIKVFNFTKQQ